ncbi:MAG: hypothetical protein CVV34_00550 [Methanomicrobiales archaeon HGW-Methanomicrobiales-5]|jgi:cell division protein YceG involved in septum cleavage|nr:MAG: hypothetical protein CVV34_00550 [Methanomicrobiales archaeon HGW-Methanomicrobiales-5]
MENKQKIQICIIIIVVFFLGFLAYLNWFGIQEGQSKLSAYPITVFSNGSGTSSILESVDKTLIENATHLTEKDLSEYPAIAEVLTGERSFTRGFSKVGGVAPGEEYVFAKKYYVSEYKGDYYILLVMLH